MPKEKSLIKRKSIRVLTLAKTQDEIKARQQDKVLKNKKQINGQKELKNVADEDLWANEKTGSVKAFQKWGNFGFNLQIDFLNTFHMFI